jgi:hypothetical protein
MARGATRALEMRLINLPCFRMQIHIDLRVPSRRQITIFSKSKRDSTLDRYATHGEL